MRFNAQGRQMNEREREKEFVSVGKASEDIILTSNALNEGTIAGSGFTTEGTMAIALDSRQMEPWLQLWIHDKGNHRYSSGLTIEGPITSSGFTAEGTLISASAIPNRGGVIKIKTKTKTGESVR